MFLEHYNTNTLTTGALDELTAFGVGQSIGVITMTPIEWRNASADSEQRAVSMDAPAETSGFAAGIKDHRSIRVVMNGIETDADLSFDYVAMVFIASGIAVGGLVTNSSVIVVASMLVSPIMGPVKAVGFGFWFKRYDLARIGVVNEVISLVICIAVGFLMGFVWYLVEGAASGDVYSQPTDEMVSRGEDATVLASGSVIAFVSGLGVALAALGDYMGTIVGVAISASLLPPAVNSGMLLALALYEAINPDKVTEPGGEFDASRIFIMAVVSLVLTVWWFSLLLKISKMLKI